MRRASLASFLVSVALLGAACSGNDVTIGVPSGSPSTTSPAATPSPSPSPSPVPNPADAELAGLLRPGTVEVGHLFPELNGVPPAEIVISSRDTTSADAFPPQPYLDVFSWNPGVARWVNVFDATTFLNPAGPNPGPVILSEPGLGQAVDFLDALELDPDIGFELLVGIQISGAAPGPLHLWVFSWPSEAFSVDFYDETERGGIVTVDPARPAVIIETGKYGPNDPGCCPSEIETRTIAFDPAAGEIRIVDRVTRPA